VVFDGFSTFSRKNPSGAVEAFTRAFARRDRDVRLIVKSMNGRCGGDEWIRLQRLAAADDRIVLIDEVFDRDRLLGLLNCCDCYVSLHRAEGFGRVLAEAMLLGKPVIATNHSGNTDFTHAGTAFLVGGSLVSVRPSEYFCAADQYWCNPDIDHAAEQMQRCLNDEAHRQQVAAAGQDFIRAHYNPQVVGQRYRERLEALARVEPCHGTC
jgi:glycosyltransferase involved in cell wall biosynthesis